MWNFSSRPSPPPHTHFTNTAQGQQQEKKYKKNLLEPQQKFFKKNLN